MAWSEKAGRRFLAWLVFDIVLLLAAILAVVLYLQGQQARVEARLVGATANSSW